ncbi:hypothetical protein FWK35_00008321 [Aphis craccivora]|uniref:Uncharacterized protein n=1 Tax=Aphis craccivora TaxID=307492 RepID=A0A6G0YVW4_APHCR|nr:hypothetical protein FWK35_00008321 [Aphis craccivora]
MIINHIDNVVNDNFSSKLRLNTQETRNMIESSCCKALKILVFAKRICSQHKLVAPIKFCNVGSN